jgi:hypothetical protein
MDLVSIGQLFAAFIHSDNDNEPINVALSLFEPEMKASSVRACTHHALEVGT